MNKHDRQKLIKELITNNEIYRQEELVQLLLEYKVKVTQATVSRDINELQLMKLPVAGGKYRYILPHEHTSNAEQKLQEVLRDVFVLADYNDKLCVIKVLPGNGPIVSGLVEKMEYPGFFATLDDDDTIMIFMRTASEARKIYQEIIRLVS